MLPSNRPFNSLVRTPLCVCVCSACSEQEANCLGAALGVDYMQALVVRDDDTQAAVLECLEEQGLSTPVLSLADLDQSIPVATMPASAASPLPSNLSHYPQTVASPAPKAFPQFRLLCWI